MTIKTTGWGFTKNKVELTEMSRLTPEEMEEVFAWSGQANEKFLEDNEYVIRIGEVVEFYDPISSGQRLWTDFYNVTDNKDALSFYKKYGPMFPRSELSRKAIFGPPKLHPWENEIYLETLGEFFHHQKAFRQTVNLYRHRDNETLLKRYLRNDGRAKNYLNDFESLRFHAARFIAFAINSNLGQLRYIIEYKDKTDYGTAHNIPEDYFFPTITYRTLLEAIHWQFRNTVIEGQVLVDCKNPDCAAVFVPVHGNQEFHSPACKQSFNDRKRPSRKSKTKKKPEKRSEKNG